MRQGIDIDYLTFLTLLNQPKGNPWGYDSRSNIIKVKSDDRYIICKQNQSQPLQRSNDLRESNIHRISVQSTPCLIRHHSIIDGYLGTQYYRQLQIFGYLAQLCSFLYCVKYYRAVGRFGRLFIENYGG